MDTDGGMPGDACSLRVMLPAGISHHAHAMTGSQSAVGRRTPEVRESPSAVILATQKLSDTHILQKDGTVSVWVQSVLLRCLDGSTALATRGIRGASRGISTLNDMPTHCLRRLPHGRWDASLEMELVDIISTVTKRPGVQGARLPTGLESTGPSTGHAITQTCIDQDGIPRQHRRLHLGRFASAENAARAWARACARCLADALPGGDHMDLQTACLRAADEATQHWRLHSSHRSSTHTQTKVQHLARTYIRDRPHRGRQDASMLPLQLPSDDSKRRARETDTNLSGSLVIPSGAVRGHSMTGVRERGGRVNRGLERGPMPHAPLQAPGWWWAWLVPATSIVRSLPCNASLGVQLLAVNVSTHRVARLLPMDICRQWGIHGSHTGQRHDLHQHQGKADSSADTGSISRAGIDEQETMHSLPGVVASDAPSLEKSRSRRAIETDGVTDDLQLHPIDGSIRCVLAQWKSCPDLNSGDASSHHMPPPCLLIISRPRAVVPPSARAESIDVQLPGGCANASGADILTGPIAVVLATMPPRRVGWVSGETSSKPDGSEGGGVVGQGVSITEGTATTTAIGRGQFSSAPADNDASTRVLADTSRDGTGNQGPSYVCDTLPPSFMRGGRGSGGPAPAPPSGQRPTTGRDVLRRAETAPGRGNLSRAGHIDSLVSTAEPRRSTPRQIGIAALGGSSRRLSAQLSKHRALRGRFSGTGPSTYAGDANSSHERVPRMPGIDGHFAGGRGDDTCVSQSVLLAGVAPRHASIGSSISSSTYMDEARWLDDASVVSSPRPWSAESGYARLSNELQGTRGSQPVEMETLHDSAPRWCQLAVLEQSPRAASSIGLGYSSGFGTWVLRMCLPLDGVNVGGRTSGLTGDVGQAIDIMQPHSKSEVTSERTCEKWHGVQDVMLAPAPPAPVEVLTVSSFPPSISDHVPQLQPRRRDFMDAPSHPDACSGSSASTLALIEMQGSSEAPQVHVTFALGVTQGRGASEPKSGSQFRSRLTDTMAQDAGVPSLLPSPDRVMALEPVVAVLSDDQARSLAGTKGSRDTGFGYRCSLLANCQAASVTLRNSGDSEEHCIAGTLSDGPVASEAAADLLLQDRHMRGGRGGKLAAAIGNGDGSGDRGDGGHLFVYRLGSKLAGLIARASGRGMEQSGGTSISSVTKKQIAKAGGHRQSDAEKAKQRKRERAEKARAKALSALTGDRLPQEGGGECLLRALGEAAVQVFLGVEQLADRSDEAQDQRRQRDRVQDPMGGLVHNSEERSTACQFASSTSSVGRNNGCESSLESVVAQLGLNMESARSLLSTSGSRDALTVSLGRGAVGGTLALVMGVLLQRGEIGVSFT